MPTSSAQQADAVAAHHVAHQRLDMLVLDAHADAYLGGFAVEGLADAMELRGLQVLRAGEQFVDEERVAARAVDAAL
jgi:hypothetical protein